MLPDRETCEANHERFIRRVLEQQVIRLDAAI
jgi:hypothetical protein